MIPFRRLNKAMWKEARIYGHSDLLNFNRKSTREGGGHVMKETHNLFGEEGMCQKSKIGFLYPRQVGNIE